MTVTLGGWVEMETHDIGTSIYNEQPLTADKRALKRRSLDSAIAADDRSAFKMMAMSREGLVTAKYRRVLWPKLLGVDLRGLEEDESDVVEESQSDDTERTQIDDNNTIGNVDENEVGSNNGPPVSTLEGGWHALPPHPEEEQVRLDVNRSFVFYPMFASDNEREERRRDLFDVIAYVLRRNPALSYYQGYHDVAQVLLLVLGRSLAMRVLEHVSLYLLRDFMLPTMDSSIDHLRLLPAIIGAADSDLGQLLAGVEPYYALSSVITVFAHDMDSFDDICTVFDYVFASGSMVVPLYLYVSMVVSRKAELEALQTTDCDILHSVLSQFPSPISPALLFDVMARASTLLEIYPPQHLDLWSDISEYSVLKTTAAPQPPGRRYSTTHDLDSHSLGSFRTRLDRTSSAQSYVIEESEEDEAALEKEMGADDETDSDSGQRSTTPPSLSDSTATIPNERPFTNSFMESEKQPLRLLALQIEESNRKAAEKKRREEERRRLAQLKAASANNKVTTNTGGASSAHIGIFSLARVSELLHENTRNSSNIVVLSRLLRHATRALLPRTGLGMSLYVGIFSVLMAHYYFNQGRTELFAGVKLHLQFAWEKMVVRYF
ncbi:hypothetical protein D0Z00_002657 [Geotrichum galactomycetum]|uniref:Uncharacterized protein n=1 Tax=Geotrichum galactomycetum TaxID=27317 RepID=A0ACB6V3I8_9ASCO|nr:hypothetical protein D0Z00_002657 [Geotrichum candidum]